MCRITATVTIQPNAASGRTMRIGTTSAAHESDFSDAGRFFFNDLGTARSVPDMVQRAAG